MKSIDNLLEMENFSSFPELKEGKVAGVYLIEHKTSKRFYVGSSENLYQRKAQHLSDLKHNKHKNKTLQEAYNNTPDVAFVAVKLDTKENALNYEQEILDKFSNSNLLFNVAVDSRKNFLGLNHSEESKKFMVNQRKSHAHTDETKEKIRNTMRDHIASEGSLEAMRVSNTMRSKQVSIEGVVYESMAAAARALGISDVSVPTRIRSKKEKYSNWKYVQDEDPPKAEMREKEQTLVE